MPETINQIAEDRGYTGHDTLIIASQHTNDLMLTLWVDTGIGGVPIAMAYQSDREILMTKVYGKENYTGTLSGQEVKKIFECIFSDPGLLAIIHK